MIKRMVLFFVVFFSLVFSVCGSLSVDTISFLSHTQTPTISPTQTLSPTPSLAITPSPTATITNTLIIVPTLTLTPLPWIQTPLPPTGGLGVVFGRVLKEGEPVLFIEVNLSGYASNIARDFVSRTVKTSQDGVF